MIRALEVAKQTGVPLSHRQTQFQRPIPAGQCRAFVLKIPRDQLHQRINRRVDQMFQDGLIDEVRGLVANYGSLSRTASQAVGYREVIDWLQSETPSDLSDLKTAVAAHTRRLARRQETWFRSFSELSPVPLHDGDDPEQIADRIAAQL
jgi:tRNA dimethylallyltransferase